MSEVEAWSQEVRIDWNDQRTGSGVHFLLEDGGRGPVGSLINDAQLAEHGDVATLGRDDFLVRPARESVGDTTVIVPGKVRVGLTEREDAYGDKAELDPEALAEAGSVLAEHGVHFTYTPTERAPGEAHGYAQVAVEPIVLKTSSTREEVHNGEVLAPKRELVIASLRTVVAYSLAKSGVKRNPQRVNYR